MSTQFPPSKSELLETFEELEDWEERYEFILDVGRELPKLPGELLSEESKVNGCMSTVWMDVQSAKDADVPVSDLPIQIQADSDSLIVRGLIVLLLSLYDCKSPGDAIAEDPQAFFNELGLNQHLSPNRRNGLYSMIGRIREECVRLAAEQ